MVGRVVKLALLVGIVVLVGLAVFRPAALFGVDGKALANSLGGEIDHSQAKCVGQGSGRWRCVLSGGNVGGVEYALTTHPYGCWSATRVVLPADDSPVERSVSGCIGLADMFGS
jgi:hypothetical protein